LPRPRGLEALHSRPRSAIKIAKIARVHAEIWAELAGAGQPICAHDLWIAATALAHGLAVATGSPADFERVPGLEVIAIA
jgi:predicted nucleic acid-binding protein